MLLKKKTIYFGNGTMTTEEYNERKKVNLAEYVAYIAEHGFSGDCIIEEHTVDYDVEDED
jgi:hypothetical protein